jgi:hypothetical protein
MKISAPYGYDQIVPLQKTHRVRMPAGATPAFCRRLNALAISLAEFTVAARDYPIVFATLDGGRSFAPVIVVGLDRESNLFVDPSGEWDRAAYFPAFVRRYPFCISKLYVDGEPKSERVVCVASASIDADKGVELFDASGSPTPPWQDAERLLRARAHAAPRALHHPGARRGSLAGQARRHASGIGSEVARPEGGEPQDAGGQGHHGPRLRAPAFPRELHPPGGASEASRR